jgi:hypothetical protein
MAKLEYTEARAGDISAMLVGKPELCLEGVRNLVCLARWMWKGK